MEVFVENILGRAGCGRKSSGAPQKAGRAAACMRLESVIGM